MNSKRLEVLKQYVTEEPDDPFNWYAMALEYAKEDSATASKLFTKILTDFPDYVPAYYQAGMLAMDQGDVEKARKIFAIGMTLARDTGDLKSFNELRSAAEELL